MFYGNPKYFRDLVKQIEKYCKLTGLPEARMRLIAYQSSKGLSADLSIGTWNLFYRVHGLN